MSDSASVAEILRRLPPGKRGAFGLLLESLLAGQPEVAASNARVVARAVKESDRKPIRAVKQ